MKIQNITVQGDSGTDYQVAAAQDGSLWCTCPSWRNKSRLSASERTCKHIDFLTREFAMHFAKTHDAVSA